MPVFHYLNSRFKENQSCEYVCCCNRSTMRRNSSRESWTYSATQTWWISPWMCTKICIRTRKSHTVRKQLNSLLCCCNTVRNVVPHTHLICSQCLSPQMRYRLFKLAMVFLSLQGFLVIKNEEILIIHLNN